MNICLRVRQFLLIAITLTSAAGVGCGGGSDAPELNTVTGTVTFDGEPVEQGRVQFTSDSGAGRSFSGEIVDGKYELKAEAGTMKVMIYASKPNPDKMSEPASPDEEPVPVMEMYIPEKYNSKSTLTADVKAGENDIPFTLTSGE